MDIPPTSTILGEVEVLSAANWLQLLVPAGFAYGYCTLEANCGVTYKLTSTYAQEAEDGRLWNDPAPNIDWPIPTQGVTLNERDANWPLFNQRLGAF